MRVNPKSNDLFYVYALCKPCGTPFYIGKGKGSRINDHFKPSNLKVNNRKTATIKKYGDSVKREILTYFTNEQDAYDTEEWLISHYGLCTEGGLLTNYAKTRFEYSDSFNEEVSKLGHLSRKRTYSEEVILKAFKMYFTDCLPKSEISKTLSIPINYLSYCLRGLKNKKLFQDNVGKTVVKNREYAPEIRVCKPKVKKKKPISKREKDCIDRRKIIEELLQQGLSKPQIILKTGLPKTTVHRTVNKIVSGEGILIGESRFNNK